MTRKGAVDADAVQRDWRERGFSCGLWVDPPGQVWEGYVHDRDELFMVVEGTLELEVKGRIYRPDVGEEILIPAQARHSVRNKGTAAARWLYGYRR